MGAYRPSEDEDGLASYLHRRPALKDWDRPTAWLLGTEMLSSLRQLILSTIHTGFDLRDWMTPEPGGVPLHDQSAERLPRPEDRTAGEHEYWFDFIADTGDAPALVFSVARAMQRSQLHVEGAARTLPRGRLLVIGGDTAYPVAHETALRERWQAPLWWAHRANGGTGPAAPIPVYAIPANHDYFDALDGFNRQFRKQATADGVPSLKYPDTGPPLRLPGYERRQSASYFALQLPFGWHLWGVDLGARPTEDKPIDTRQQQYFRTLDEPAPEKLIVVTALPVAVHHARAEELESPFEQLGLPRAFSEGGRLDASHLRLDLSGDVHLYERYWGTTVPGETLVGDDGTRAAPPAEPRTNYVAVTSGLGGAFHHPIQVRHFHDEKDRITPARSWPPERESRERIGDVLTRPRKVFQAGSVGVVGAALGILFYLLARTEWGDGPGVLAVPEALWAERWHDAARSARHFGAVMLFIVLIASWGGVAAWLRGGTQRILDAMIEPSPAPDDRWGVRLDRWRRRLDRAFGGDAPDGYRARLLRWTGANRRVMTSVILRAPVWLLFLASIAGLATAGWFLFRDTQDEGTNFAAALLVAWMAAFPLLTNDLRNGRRVFPLLLVGILHGCAHLFTPQLWAGATAALVLPMLVLAGYWCVRPLPALLFARHGRWLTPVWLVLVAVMLAAPLALPRMSLTSWNGGYSIAVVAWLALGVAGVVAAYAWVRAGKWDFWRWGVLAAMLMVQVGTLLALPEVHTWTNSETEWWLGLVAAAVGGAIFACLWLGWYLVVCVQWGWHGNDAGSVARVDDYAEFLRIKLTKDAAEVWTIAVDADVKKPDPMNPTTFAAGARLVDHFIVRAKGA